MMTSASLVKARAIVVGLLLFSRVNQIKMAGNKREDPMVGGKIHQSPEIILFFNE